MARGRRPGIVAERKGPLIVTMIAEPDSDPAWLAAIRSNLLAWYAEGHRPLPWRIDSNPYAVLVSEVMLVQTTVEAVVPYFERFLARFPTIEVLAIAEEEEVTRVWEGLGYYRRARQLHAAARMIVDRYQGQIPSSTDALRELPGVGRYIAGAVASFAFGLRAPILEANTQRVVARWLGWDEPLTSSRTQKRLWEAAARLVPEEDPGQFNQAFMELGATLCKPRAPRCLACPVHSHCRAYLLGRQESIPMKAERARPVEVSEVCALILSEARFLVLQRGPGLLWEGFWEFPTLHLKGPDPARRGEVADSLEDGFLDLTGVEIRLGEIVHHVRFGVTRYRIDLAIRPAKWIRGEPRPASGFVAARWLTPHELKQVAMPSAHRKLCEWITRQDRFDRFLESSPG